MLYTSAKRNEVIKTTFFTFKTNSQPIFRSSTLNSIIINKQRIKFSKQDSIYILTQTISNINSNLSCE